MPEKMLSLEAVAPLQLAYTARPAAAAAQPPKQGSADAFCVQPSAAPPSALLCSLGSLEACSLPKGRARLRSRENRALQAWQQAKAAGSAADRAEAARCPYSMGPYVRPVWDAYGNSTSEMALASWLKLKAQEQAQGAFLPLPYTPAEHAAAAAARRSHQAYTCYVDAPQEIDQLTVNWPLMQAMDHEEYVAAAPDSPHAWAMQGDATALARFLSCGGSRDARRDAIEAPRGEQAMTPLLLAAKWGHAEVVRLLLTGVDFTTNVNVRDAWGATPLWYACDAGRQEVVDLLLAVDAVDVHLPRRAVESADVGAVVGFDDTSPLAAATLGGYCSIVQKVALRAALRGPEEPTAGPDLLGMAVDMQLHLPTFCDCREALANLV